MLPGIKRITPQIGLWLGVILICTFTQMFALKSAWQFDRLQIANHDWWLLLSGNFVHLNLNHYLLNMSGLMIVVLFFSSQLKAWQWLVLLLVTSLSVGLGMYWLNPEVVRYVGLSGVLHGLFVAGAVTEIKRYPISGWLLLLGLVIKIIWEQTQGAMPGTEHLIHGRVMVDSHFYGAISGAIIITIFKLYEKVKLAK